MHVSRTVQTFGTLCLVLVTLFAVGTANAQMTDEEKEALTTPGAEQPGLPLGVTCSGDAAALFYPLDGTYTLVDFFGDGCTGSGCAQGPDQHNDDDSAGVAIPFTFDLYGSMWNSLFVNNNGNLSFGTYFSTFTAEGFPIADFPMVAPFWGDVDTGNPSNFIGDVYMKLFDGNGDTNDETLVVTWDNVGYYNEHGDLLSTFQVAISDGSNPVMGLGNNVCFSWDNMCWTTGDASQGTGGFGGVPATVGVNKGDGVEYIQIGRFDHEGVDYDGPFGNADGVSYLDYSVTCFNIGELTNIAPIAQGFPAGNKVTVDASLNEVVDLTLQFISPEAGQTVTVGIADVNGAQAAGLAIANNSPQLEVVTVDLDWTPDCGDAGSYVLSFTASDNFTPPGVTNIDLQINVLCPLPDEACCLPDGSCVHMTEPDCVAQGGVPQGPGTVCTAVEACCFPDDTCVMADPLCCDDLGGVPQGPGSTCGGMEACCDSATGACYMADATCCLANGDTPQGPGTVCTQPMACCFPDYSCVALDPLCCQDLGGTVYGGACAGDSNGDGADDTCLPPPLTGACCNDRTGVCTNGVTQTACEGSGARYGGDGSTCATIDPTCDAPPPPPPPEGVPAVSTWGVAIIVLALLVGLVVKFRRRPEAT